MKSLFGRHVFLSASFPSGKRGERFRPFDAGAIADAVSAIVRVVLTRDGKLLFGGHPTITPLVLMIGHELGVRQAVDVFQSRWFEQDIPVATRDICGSQVGDIHWTERCRSVDESLQEMRACMFRFVRPVGAVFVGGMEGIIAEHGYVGRVLGGVPRIPIGGPGGAAARLPTASEELPQVLRGEIASRHYPFLASLIVDALAEYGPRGEPRINC